MSDLEQFCILAEKQKGRGIALLIQQVLGNKNIFFFGEFLSIPSVNALQEGEEYVQVYKTLEMFAYLPKYSYFKANRGDFIDLNEAQFKKLKLLSLLSLAEMDQTLSYDILKAELDLSDVRAVEDLIIEAVYAGILQGKFDQRRGVFIVKDMVGRDVARGEMNSVISDLEHWITDSHELLVGIERSSKILQSRREGDVAEKAKLKERIDALVQSLDRNREMGGCSDTASSRADGFAGFDDDSVHKNSMRDDIQRSRYAQLGANGHIPLSRQVGSSSSSGGRGVSSSSAGSSLVGPATASSSFQYNSHNVSEAYRAGGRLGRRRDLMGGPPSGFSRQQL